MKKKKDTLQRVFAFSVMAGLAVDARRYRYKQQLLSWLSPGGDFVLGHWGKKHSLDWLPIGPRRRSRARIEDLLSPELKEVEYTQELVTGVPMPFGPTILGMGFWFKRQ